MDKIDLETLVFYDTIRQNKIVNLAVRILNEFNNHGDVLRMSADYYTIQRELLAATATIEISGTYWQNYICRLAAESENRFSLMSEKEEFSRNIGMLAIRDLQLLQNLYSFDWQLIAGLFGDVDTSVCCMEERTVYKEMGRDLIRKTLEATSQEDLLKGFKQYYRDHSCGVFGQYHAFLWDDGLVGVKNYDPITFEMLIGYEKQKELLIENTEFFLDGHRANNVLLYGDRGTGKSSCVKALLNRFKERKLKIISLNKNHVDHLYQIMETIAGRGCKFIIFIDDLSFEDTEIGYKHFKSVIDGGIEAQPCNTLIYVTTNRRNIIKETWSDRGETAEVHHGDGMQERLSLADRFGLTITFTSPDHEAYLKIVRGLAKQEHLSIGEHELTEEAIRWELRQNGRSGRAAKQFYPIYTGKKI